MSNQFREMVCSVTPPCPRCNLIISVAALSFRQHCYVPCDVRTLGYPSGKPSVRKPSLVILTSTQQLWRNNHVH